MTANRSTYKNFSTRQKVVTHVLTFAFLAVALVAGIAAGMGLNPGAPATADTGTQATITTECTVLCSGGGSLGNVGNGSAERAGTVGGSGGIVVPAGH